MFKNYKSCLDNMRAGDVIHLNYDRTYKIIQLLNDDTYQLIYLKDGNEYTVAQEDFLFNKIEKIVKYNEKATPLPLSSQAG